MTTTPAPSAPVHRSRDGRDVLWAWLCLAAMPFVAVVTFVAGEGLATAMGYEGVGAAPWWTALAVLVAVAALLAVPALLAVRFAARAHAVGDDRGRVPAAIAVIGAAGFIGLNLVSWALMALFGE